MGGLYSKTALSVEARRGPDNFSGLVEKKAYKKSCWQEPKRGKKEYGEPSKKAFDWVVGNPAKRRLKGGRTNMQPGQWKVDMGVFPARQYLQMA